MAARRSPSVRSGSRRSGRGPRRSREGGGEIEQREPLAGDPLELRDRAMSRVASRPGQLVADLGAPVERDGAWLHRRWRSCPPAAEQAVSKAGSRVRARAPDWLASTRHVQTLRIRGSGGFGRPRSARRRIGLAPGSPYRSSCKAELWIPAAKALVALRRGLDRPVHAVVELLEPEQAADLRVAWARLAERVLDPGRLRAAVLASSRSRRSSSASTGRSCRRSAL